LRAASLAASPFSFLATFASGLFEELEDLRLDDRELLDEFEEFELLELENLPIIILFSFKLFTKKNYFLLRATAS
jgi:hypothetical protein